MPKAEGAAGMSIQTIFGLMRHGQTLANRDKVIQGQTESPLSPYGEGQAAAWGVSLEDKGFERILSSDLGRAKETARIINQSLGGLPMQQDARLREQDWGRWTGLSIPELSQNDPELKRQEARGWDFRPPGGENRRQLLARATAALDHAAHNHPGRRILVVCHMGVINCIMSHLNNLSYGPGDSYFWKGYYLHYFSHDGQALSVRELNVEI